VAHLVSINDVTTAEILELCRRQYRDWWAKRFAEDLVEVLSAAGRPMASDQTVKLVLKNPAGGGLTTVNHAPMTRENRNSVYRIDQQYLDGSPNSR
jgi:hypothetical protein